MLVLTPSAVEVVTAMAEASGEADTAGLRIAQSGTTPETEGLEVAFVATPADQDQVVTQGGARVFLESGAAEYLSDKVLAGEFDDEGNVRFGLSTQNDARA